MTSIWSRLAMSALFAACATPAPKPAAPPSVGSGELTILDRGAPPRQALGYPTSGFAHVVTLRWGGSAHSTDSHSGRDERVEYVERTLEGTLVDAGLGRATIDLLTGTSRPARPEGLDGFRSEAPAFDVELPAHFAFDVDRHRLDAEPIEARSDHDSTYREVMFAALPRIFPSDEIGRGARWKIVSRQQDRTTTVTWELSAIEGATVTLTGRTITDFGANQARASIDIHSTIDLSAFTVDATVARSSHRASSNSLTSQTGDSHDEGTLSIKRR